MSEDNLDQTGLPEGNDPAGEPLQTGEGSAAGSEADWQAKAERYRQQMEGWRQQADNLQGRLNQHEQYFAAIAQRLQDGGQITQKQQEAAEEYATPSQAKALNEAVLAGDDAAVARVMNEIAVTAARAGAKQGAAEASKFFRESQQQQQLATNAFGWARDPKYSVLNQNNHPVTQQALARYQQWAADPSAAFMYQPVDVGGQRHYPALLKMAVDQTFAELGAVPGNSQFVDLASAGVSSAARSAPVDASKAPAAFVAQMKSSGYEDAKEIARAWENTTDDEKDFYLAAKK